MRKLCCIIILLFLFLVYDKSSAQFNIGLIGGRNTANLKADKKNPFGAIPEDFKKRNSSGFGMVLEYQIISNLLLHTELMFLEKGSNYTVVSESQKFRLSYLESW